MSPIIPFLIILPLVILLTVRAAIADTYHSPAAATLLSAFRGAAIIIIAVLSLWWSWERPLRDTRPVSALILIDEASGNSAESERIARKLRTVVNARNGRTLSATYNRVAGNKPGGNGLAGVGPDGTGRALGSYNSFEAALPIVRWLMKVNPDISIAVISDVLPEELHGPEFAGINLSWNQANGASRNHPIKDVIYPGVIFANQVFRIQVRIAPGPRQQELVLSVNNSRIESRPLSGAVSPGDIVIFDLALKTPGIHSVELTVLDRDESIIGQHRLPIRALQEPDILYYSPMGNKTPLSGYLDNRGMVIRSLPTLDLISGALPEAGVSGRDSLLILDSTPPAYFNRRLVSSLSDVVLRKGYKLLILPGSDISPKDRGAAIENILPVKFGLEENDDPGADLAFVAVVDTSLSMFFNTKGVSTFARGRGSEGGLTTKIDMAKKAIMNLAGAIKESDRMGVLTVTDRPSWVIKPSQPRKVDEEAELIRRISAFGPGINLYSGLLAAYQELDSLNSDLKHILVFLDTADVDEYQVADRGTVWELLEEMKEQGITVSLIGFGKAGDPHIPQLNRFAEESGGYFYLTSDIEEIPGFGLMDLEQVADSLLNFQARKVDFFSSDFPGIDSFPDLNGQVVTTLKPGAALYAWSDRELPLFATWPFGTGKVGVFTADGGQSLAREWVKGNPDQVPWLAILAKFLSDDLPATDLFYSGGDGTGTVLTKTAFPDSAEGLEVVTSYLDGSSRTFPMEKVGLDRYEASFRVPGRAPNAVELKSTARGDRLAFRVIPAFQATAPTPTFTTIEFEPARAEIGTSGPDRWDPSLFRLLILLAIFLISLDEFFRPPSPEN